MRIKRHILEVNPEAVIYNTKELSAMLKSNLPLLEEQIRFNEVFYVEDRIKILYLLKSYEGYIRFINLINKKTNFKNIIN